MNDVESVLARADDMLARLAPYDELLGALTECARLPGAEPFMLGIWQRRLNTLHTYDRPDDERARVLDEFLKIDVPLLWRASSVGAVCADRPELEREYMLPIIAELEAAAPNDPVLADVLVSMRRARDRTLGTLSDRR